MTIAFLSGIFNGCFPLPMKYSRVWRWENTWVLFMLVSTVLLPLVSVSLFVPNLMGVYHEVPWRALLPPLIFGFLWGTAQVTIGLSFKAVGVALAFAVVAGMNALFGSLIPLLVLHPRDVFRPRGLLLLVSMPILFLGLWLYAQAGRRREKEQPPPDSAAGGPKVSFAKGLALCIYTGLIGGSINLGFAFGGDVVGKSLSLGANAVTSTYAVWLLVLWAGFIPSAIYCPYLLARNRGWGLFTQPGAPREALLAIAMAVIWVTAIFAYGVGATMAGKYGTSLGYALLVAVTIVASTMVGVLTGEWKRTSGETRKVLFWATAIVLASVIILNLGGLF
jgi:L-rhamnose-H+ transport protein